MDLNPSERQYAMLRLFGEMISDREDWGGQLVLAYGGGSELACAPVSIAGGTVLLLNPDARPLKVALRRGELDFIVNTLDEALRILKNEIRQHKPVSVGLVAELPAAIAEIVERGVSPCRSVEGFVPLDVHRQIEENVESMHRLVMGYLQLHQTDDPERWQRPWISIERKRYYAWHVQAESLAKLREADAVLLDALPEGDRRRRWIKLLPRYVRDSVEAGRWVWLSEEEFEGLPHDLPIRPERRP